MTARLSEILSDEKGFLFLGSHPVLTHSFEQICVEEAPQVLEGGEGRRRGGEGSGHAGAQAAVEAAQAAAQAPDGGRRRPGPAAVHLHVTLHQM